MRNLFLAMMIVVIAVVAAAFVILKSRRRLCAGGYKTATVQRGSISSTVTATGTLDPVTTVQVGSQISGIVAGLCALSFVLRVRRLVW
ncbi:MAG: hypothetical protein JW952_05755 [Candidatus Eisenbacteria bacterium]|nr:hypothetical protein [Candidatus Eisenbacteria bacterium]